ncbi:DUF3649 domain-containing protein [Pseudomonas sp. SCB32]|uniref:DUF3649 domain-containing protein n=1 Tax=Pseudomonas sp. SCB32 TaxID=2653853 RepID=UPI00126455FD|nr:DUF3649 domain-containing protein [Pseudomonas sp. SCB32]
MSASPHARRLSGIRAGAVAARILSAVFGGYALAYTATAFLSVYLPMARPDRVSFASLASFFVWVAAIIYVFGVRSPWRAVWAPVALSVVLGLAAFLPGGYGVRP